MHALLNAASLFSVSHAVRTHQVAGSVEEALISASELSDYTLILLAPHQILHGFPHFSG